MVARAVIRQHLVVDILQLGNRDSRYVSTVVSQYFSNRIISTFYSCYSFNM